MKETNMEKVEELKIYSDQTPPQQITRDNVRDILLSELNNFRGNFTSYGGKFTGFSCSTTGFSSVSGSNTFAINSGATSLVAGPTSSPTVSLTRAGVLSATGAILDGTTTLGGRSGSTLATAIDSSGYVNVNAPSAAISDGLIKVTTANSKSRITGAGFFNFPQYRHRSEFDEATNAWAATNIAKTYWTAGGSSGTAEIVNSAEYPYALLSTTATGSRTATITFNKSFTLDSSCGIEAFFKPSSTTHSRWFWGWYKDATHYIGFLFDTDFSNTVIFFGWANGAGDNVINTGVTVSTSVGKRYTILRETGTISATTLYAMIDGTAVPTNADNPFDPGSGYSPYFYIDNKTNAENKTLKIAYIDVFGDRSV